MVEIDAPSAEKNTKESRPAFSAACTMRHVAMPLSSSMDPCGWAFEHRQVHHRVDAAQRIAK